MEFNKESFEKALKANKIVRYQKHFEAVVRSYLEAETEQCNTANVVRESEQCAHESSKISDDGKYWVCADCNERQSD